MKDALDIHVKGIVQGVGFRPFVYRLAKKYLINGWVLNAADGVHIRAEGDEKLVDEFVMEISENAPAAAKVTEIDIKEVPLEPFDAFEIRMSDDDAVEEATFVSPDLATCSDCQRELFDPDDRRYRYPFINCTNCGPRFTIIDELPYDRCNTSMGAFRMCEECQREYDDPVDRRFHAQPDACFECGPHLSFSEDAGKTVRWGNTREESDAIFARAVDMLLDGKILAVKGLGGYHLVCDANNEAAIAELRRRKHRYGKAFAVMMHDLDDVRRVCEVGVEEAAVLEGSVRPIVLLKKQLGCQLAEGLADRLPELGVMLPYTPVQHLLLHDFAEAWEARGGCEGRTDGRGDRARVSGQIEVEPRSQPSIFLTNSRHDPRAHCCDPHIGGCEDCARVSGQIEVEPRSQPSIFLTNSRHNPRTRRSNSCIRNNPPMLVMTSGNVHDEPIVIEDDEAYEKLAGIADAFLGNDREILTRFDDSVVRVIKAGSSGETVQTIRRARGYAPSPIAIKQSQKADSNSSNCIFAAGPEQKNTFAFLRSSIGHVQDDSAQPQAEVFVSQHIGDMENAEAFDAWLQAKRRYERLFDLHADKLACDPHPEYITSKWAREHAALSEPPLPVVEVQHHHAHIASVIAENGLASDEAVCGIAFDGTGYGADGNIWGGEVLMANLSDFERFANFAYVPMPGGAAAVKHPLQMAYGVLWEFDLLEHPGAASVIEALGEAQAQTCETMVEQGINTPVTSSVGRLFDAASAILGVCTQPAYEGEPAILLEAAMGDLAQSGEFDGGEPYKIDVVKNVATESSTAHDTSVLLFDAAPAFRSLLDDHVDGISVPIIARKFHDAFVDVILQAAQLSLALYDIRTVALSGGVFMNRYIVERSLELLEQAGFTVAVNRDLPPNDGCVSFGEAAVALFKTS